VRPALAGVVAGHGRVWVGPISEFAIVKFGSAHRFQTDDIAELIFAGRQEIWPLTGLADGVAYSFDTDPDGSYAYLDRAAGEALASDGPRGKARILANASVRFYLSAQREPLPGFRPLATQEVLGREVFLFQAVSPVSLVRCASRVFARPNPIAFIDSTDFDPAQEAVVRGPDRDPAEPPAKTVNRVSVNRVSGIRFTPGGLSAEVEAAAPSIVVFAANYFRFWRSSVDGIPAGVEIADGAFCGVRVAPGHHRVELSYDRRPFAWGCIGAGLFLIVTLLAVRSTAPTPMRPSPRAPAA
jgi:hypothetical protein